MELGGLAINGANFRVFNDPGGGIGHEEIGGSARNREGHVTLVQMPQLIQGNRVATGRSRGSGRRTGGTAGGVRVDGNSCALWRQDAQISEVIRAGLKHLDLNDHFRLGLVDVLDDLFDERELIRGVPDNNGILCVHLRNAL